MYKKFIVLTALVALAIGAAVKKEEIENKKDKRGLINLGYGYAYTPDLIAYPHEEYVFPHQAVTVEKHFQVPAPIPVYDSYHIEATKPVIPVAQSFHPIPFAVKVPDATFHLPYAKRYTYGITRPILVD